jgi:hypothetical protein
VPFDLCIAEREQLCFGLWKVQMSQVACIPLALKHLATPEMVQIQVLTIASSFTHREM